MKNCFGPIKTVFHFDINKSNKKFWGKQEWGAKSGDQSYVKMLYQMYDKHDS